jgi:hypothetical protein
MLLRHLIFLSMLCLPGLAGAAAKPPPGEGAQLVDAIDAAWVRILKRDVFRQLVNKHGLQDVAINIADCLPKPQVTFYPEQPTGRLKRILETQQVNVGFTEVGLMDEGATGTIFTELSADLLSAVFGEMADHYGYGPIKLNYVPIRPPFPITSTLNSGKIDIVGLVNALGGETEDLRRRDSRQFTCTMTATRQMIWVKKEGGPDWQHANDAFDDPELKLCVGPLSNQMTNAYFDKPGQQGKTEYVQDLKICLGRLLRGEIDGMMSPFTNDSFFPEKIDTTGDGKPDTATAGVLRPIDTNIVAGTPLWVAVD